MMTPMSGLSLVTVLIPTFNRPALLRQAVLSACRQSHRGLEILVLDDHRDPGFIATLMRPLEAGPGRVPGFCDPKVIDADGSDDGSDDAAMTEDAARRAGATGRSLCRRLFRAMPQP